MGISRDRLRIPLACVALGAISVAFCGLRLMTPPSSSFSLTAAELCGISLPLTVAWFSFSGLCMLADEKTGFAGAAASVSRFAGQAALLAGVPVWAYWYLHLVFRVI